MLILGGFMLILPGTFLIAAMVVVAAMPGRLQRGDIKFAKMFGFMFFRYRLDCHWYAIFYLVRNTLIAVVPVIPSATLQVMIMLFIVQVSLIVLLCVMPWRVYATNVVDGMSLLVMILVLSLSVFFIDDPDTDIIAKTCFCLVIIICAILPAAIIYGITTRLLQLRDKPFRYFLCHHKLGAGSFARLLKT